jgi:hypothetical protein
MRTIVIGILAAFLVPQDTPVQKAERFSGVMAAGPLTNGPVAVDIGISRWSTEEGRGRLAAVFQSGGQPALVEALRKEGTAAYVLMPNHERLIAAYAEQEARPDGGRRILLLCIRRPGDWEFTVDAGWPEYPFRIVALTLDAKDRGTGTLFHVAKVNFTSKGPDLVAELTGQPTKLLSVGKTR